MGGGYCIKQALSSDTANAIELIERLLLFDAGGDELIESLY